MANASILAAFQRMWDHVLIRLSNKSDLDHTHEEYYDKAVIDKEFVDVNSSISNIINGSVTVAKADKANNAVNAEEATHAQSAETADSAKTATSATKATQDGNGNVISSTYETKDSATAKLEEAKNYTDTKTSELASTGVVDEKISTHNTSTSAHNDIRTSITDLTVQVNNLLNMDNVTPEELSAVIELINSNQDLIDGIANKVDKSDIIDNLTTSVTDKPLSANQGVAVKALIDALQRELGDLQLAFDQYEPPTDTSRASKEDLETHIADGVHLKDGERTNWEDAYEHSTTAHAPSDAQANVIESIKVNNVAQSITDKSVNITVPTDTADLTNSKGYLVSDDIKNKANKATTLKGYGITDAYTTTQVDGLISDHTSKSDIHVTSEDKTNWNTAAITAEAAKTKAEEAYELADGKVGSLSDLGISASAKELDYVSGVESNIQEQLSNKAPLDHPHNYAGSSEPGGAATSAEKVNNSLSIQLNGGTAYTFDGSSAKALNITASSIGASASGHNHNDSYYTETEIDDKIATLNTAIKGKSDTNHTHNYAESSSVGGAATFANTVAVTDTTPSSATIYYPLYSTGTSDYQTVRANSDLYYYDTGASSYFNIGSSTNLGGLTLHHNNGKYINVIPGAATANRDITLPDVSGTVITTANLPSAGSSLGCVKSGGDVAISGGVITVNDDSHNHVISNVDGLQAALDGKAASSHGTHVSYGTSATAVGSSASAGSATTVSRSDHTHSLSKSAVTTALGYTPPTKDTTYSAATSSTLGLVKSGTDITVDSNGNVSVKDDSHNHIISNVDGLQSALDGKAASSHGNHVPTTQTASNKVFLRNDNTWQTVTPGNIGAATSDHRHISSEIRPSAIELMPVTTAGHGGLIDFHWNGSSADYTSRIIETGSGTLDILVTNGANVNGQPIITSGGRVTQLAYNETYGLYAIVDGNILKIATK